MNNFILQLSLWQKGAHALKVQSQGYSPKEFSYNTMCKTQNSCLTSWNIEVF